MNYKEAMDLINKGAVVSRKYADHSTRIYNSVYSKTIASYNINGVKYTSRYIASPENKDTTDWIKFMITGRLLCHSAMK